MTDTAPPHAATGPLPRSTTLQEARKKGLKKDNIDPWEAFEAALKAYSSDSVGWIPIAKFLWPNGESAPKLPGHGTGTAASGMNDATINAMKNFITRVKKLAKARWQVDTLTKASGKYNKETAARRVNRSHKNRRIR